MKILLSVALCLALAHVAIAGALEDKANALDKKYKADLQQKQDAYRKALIVVKTNYATELAGLIKQAMTANNLKVVTVLSDLKQQIDHEIHVLEQAPITTWKVMAANPWMRTILVKKGQQLKITATGQWSTSSDTSFGPNGDPDRHKWGLVGRIAGKQFPVGEAHDMTVEEDGVLELQMDDSDLKDNKGFVTVTIEVAESPDTNTK